MNRFALLAATLVLTVFASGAGAQQADPAKILTLADVEKVLAGKFAPRVPEPGAVFYEELTKDVRQVNVYLSMADGKSVDSLLAEITGQGEPAERVPGLGDAALYRSQYKEVTLEKKNQAGEVQWLSIALHNVSSEAETKRLAIALAKLAAARL